jgi:hypothetical protein
MCCVPPLREPDPPEPEPPEPDPPAPAADPLAPELVLRAAGCEADPQPETVIAAATANAATL